MEEILSLALESGLWAALFCFLFLYMLKDARTRESKYTETIDTLSSKLEGAIKALSVCDSIREKCEDISSSCGEVKSNTEQIKTDVITLLSAMEDK